MKQEPSVAIIILNWNGFDDTAECLQSIRHLDYANYTTVLVDNGSAGNEGKKLKELFGEIQLIGNKINRGFAGGCNDGINWAIKSGFDYIVTLNNDCLVESSWLANLIAGLKAAAADFATSRIMYYPETQLICSDGDGLLPDGTGIVINPLQLFQEPGSIRPVFSACGGAAVFSRTCLEAVKIKNAQYFDELFFAYLEDIDLGARLNALNFKGVSIPDAVVYHKESKTAGARSFFQMYQSEKNRLLVELLNFPLGLILLGELYYWARTLARNIFKISKQRPEAMRPLPKKEFSPWKVLLESRMWVVRNFGAILQDRRERQLRGLITWKIWNHFSWKLT